MLTRSNIAYDLEISPHQLSVNYKDESITYVFSSNLYKTKFQERQEEHRQYVNNSLTNRFGFDIHFNLLADIQLYTKIEKRGFLLVTTGGNIKCPNNLILDGVTMTKQN